MDVGPKNRLPAGLDLPLVDRNAVDSSKPIVNPGKSRSALYGNIELPVQAATGTTDWI